MANYEKTTFSSSSRRRPDNRTRIHATTAYLVHTIPPKRIGFGFTSVSRRTRRDLMARRARARIRTVMPVFKDPSTTKAAMLFWMGKGQRFMDRRKQRRQSRVIMNAKLGAKTRPPE